MKEGLNAVFPGRFQPMTIGHVEIVKKILHDNQDINHLVIATPTNKYQTWENPFESKDSCTIIRKSLNYYGLNFVDVESVNLSYGLINTWVEKLRNNRIDVVCTGNLGMAITIGIASSIVGNPVSIRHFIDGSISDIRSTEIRDNMARGNCDWKNFIAKPAVDYIEKNMPNWDELIHTRKRNYSMI